MKKAILLLMIVVGATSLFGQIDCMTGPGANGSYTDCDQGPVTYNVSDCECDFFWRYAIDGSVDINAFTNLPLTFNTGSIAGTVVSAGAGSITINWDCSDLLCCEGFVFTTIEYCGSEFFNPIIRLNCDPDPSCVGPCPCGTPGCPPCPPCDDYELLDCISTTCECLKVCVNGVVVTLNNNTNGTAIFCYPDGTDIGQVVDCGQRLICRGLEEVAEAPAHIKIPDVNITRVHSDKGTLDLSISLPESKKSFAMTISDSAGRIVYRDDEIIRRDANINLHNLEFGIYHVLLTNGNTRITQKIFVD